MEIVKKFCILDFIQQGHASLIPRSDVKNYDNFDYWQCLMETIASQQTQVNRRYFS